MIELELNKIIEALLFVSEKPLTIKQIQEVCPKTNASEIKKAMNQLKESYDRPDRGIQINEVAGGYLFCSHPDCEPYLSKLYKTKKVFRLSAPALETLAIIAYKQPVTKAEMEFIRGVNVDGVVKNLEDRELIKIKGRKEVPGRPILYGTSDKFLHYFGLKSLDDLPSLEEFAAQALEKESKFEENPEEDNSAALTDNIQSLDDHESQQSIDEGLSETEDELKDTDIESEHEEDIQQLAEKDAQQENIDDPKTLTGESDNEQDEHTETAKSN